jgi:hypothetical protein
MPDRCRHIDLFCHQISRRCGRQGPLRNLRELVILADPGLPQRIASLAVAVLQLSPLYDISIE